jgi:hypothetical protein
MIEFGFGEACQFAGREGAKDQVDLFEAAPLRSKQ